ncbi:transposase [Campylobacter coli]
MSKTKNIYSTIRSAKFVLKPTSKQKEILESFFGLSRAIYNISLYNIKNSKFGDYEIQNGKNKGSIVPRIPSEFDLNKSLPKLKEEYGFLALLPNDYAQAVMKNLSRGFSNFYSTMNYPRFKVKKNNVQSFNMYAGSRVKIDAYYPSSKTCSNCGCIKDKLLLSERTYHCEECGFEIDRDLNASINILNTGLKMIEATAAISGTSLKN